MREIKFRAWDKEKRVMIPTDSWYFSDEFEPFIDSVKSAQEIFEIMQFIGIKDKNGKEIYEGDIVQVQNWDEIRQEGYVKYTPPGQFNLVKGDFLTVAITGYDEFHKAIRKPESYQLEVIGNIYENTEFFNITL